MSSGELYGSLAFRKAMQELDEYLTQKGVSAEVRTRITDCASIMYEYIPYAIAQKKDPTDGKVLAAFLASKGLKTAKLFGNDGLNCAISIVDLLLSFQKATVATGSGVLPAGVLAWGLAMLDLIEVGNSCEFAQNAYYEAFLRSKSISMEPVRNRAFQNGQSMGLQ